MKNYTITLKGKNSDLEAMSYFYPMKINFFGRSAEAKITNLSELIRLCELYSIQWKIK